MKTLVKFMLLTVVLTVGSLFTWITGHEQASNGLLVLAAVSSCCILVTAWKMAGRE